MANKSNNIGPIGQRLRQLRRDNRWTQAEVSRKTGISTATLSKLENGLTSLNFSSVNKLAEGLDVPVMALTNPPSQMTARRNITLLGQGTLFEHDDIDYEVLCNDLSDKSHGYVKGRIKARHESEVDEYRRHDGQEFLLVLSGEMELYTEYYDAVTLRIGDSIMFDSAMGHKYVSTSDDPAVVLIGMSLSGYQDITETLAEFARTQKSS